MKLLVNNYAEALLKASIELGVQHQTLSALQNLVQYLDGDVITVLLSKSVTREVKDQIINHIIEEYKDNLCISNFIRIIHTHNRIELINDISVAYKEFLLKLEGITDAEITSSKTLTDVEIEELKQFVESKFKRKFLIKYKVDPSILGGLIIKYDSNVIDASIAGQLSVMEAENKKTLFDLR